MILSLHLLLHLLLHFYFFTNFVTYFLTYILLHLLPHLSTSSFTDFFTYFFTHFLTPSSISLHLSLPISQSSPSPHLFCSTLCSPLSSLNTAIDNLPPSSSSALSIASLSLHRERASRRLLNVDNFIFPGRIGAWL